MKKNINISFFGYCLLVVLLGFTSCKSTKTPTKHKTINQLTEKTITQVLTQQPAFLSAQASKITTTITLGERQMSTGGSVNMITDSIITLSVQPLLGIELFRAELTKQHFTIVDKMNRRYVQFSYNEIAEKTGVPINYATLQALACNQIFAIGTPTDSLKNQQIDIQKNGKQQHLHFTKSNIDHRFAINSSHFRIEQTALAISGQTDTLSITYNDLQITNEVAFPRQIILEANVANQKAQCKLNVLKLTFNGKVNVQPADLKKYQQTTLETLLKK